MDNTRNKGITLIALIITVIIMLILAGVAISTLTGNDGLIARITGVADEYNKSVTNEAETTNSFLGELDDLIKNATGEEKETETEEPKTIADLVNEGTIKVGDYVKYEPTSSTFNWSDTKDGSTYATYSGSTSNTTLTTQTTLNWRVLDIVDGKVRLISDAPTTNTVYLQSYNGYNNAVYLIDEVCKTLYSGDKGTATSLKIEDIEKYLTYDYTQYAKSNVDTGKYGGTKEYTSASYRYYPSIFAQETTGWVDGTQGTTYGLSQQNSLINQTSANLATSKIKVTQTYWYKSMVASDFKDYTTNDNMYYKLFINNGSNYSNYWLASRCVNASSSNASFCVRLVYSGSVHAGGLFNSNDDTSSTACRVRPVISLNSGITVDSSDTSKDGTTASLAWELK